MTKKTTQPYFHSLILIGLTSVGLMLVGSWAYATVANRVWFWLPMLLGLLAQGFFFYGLLHFYQQAQSQLNNLEGKVAQRTADLVTVNRERDAFLAVLTHDMKSPLTTIGLYGNMIKEHPRIILDRPHLPEILLRSQAQLLNIVENIQDLESWRAGPEVRLRHEAFDLAALLLALVENLRLQARLQNIDLSYAGAPLLPVSADRVMMERVFTNLISNAVKYTPPG
ncbi:MAG: HAMP domain-containing histidine kinase, partial [Anaerolineales bacterium]|nr:HAMP domain-containing histidine kinase [Anaerolineales bacterium]